MNDIPKIIQLPVGKDRPPLPASVKPQIVWVGLRCWPLQVLGVFATEAEAVAACETLNDVIGPMEVGKELIGGGDWIGAYYPLIEPHAPHINCRCQVDHQNQPQ